MEYKILLVDVDGTLMCPERQTVTPGVLAGLHGLQRRGISVAIATGRCAFAVRPEVMGGLNADYLICSNGAYLSDGAGRVIWDQPMSREQFEAICGLGRAGGAIGFSFADGYYCYFDETRFYEFFDRHNNDEACIHKGAPHTRHLSGMPYAGFGLVSPEAVRQFHETRSDMRMTGYAENAVDINQIDCNKATGAERLLRHLGLTWEQAVFIGDGDNDIELLRAAGLGVAMGNGKPGAKAAADRVTGSVLDDGVLTAIRDIFGAE